MSKTSLIFFIYFLFIGEKYTTAGYSIVIRSRLMSDHTSMGAKVFLLFLESIVSKPHIAREEEEGTGPGI